MRTQKIYFLSACIVKIQVNSWNGRKSDNDNATHTRENSVQGAGR